MCNCVQVHSEIKCTSALRYNVHYDNKEKKMITSKKYASLRVSEERKMALEKAAIEISYATGKPIKWSEVAFYLIDEYLKDATKDAKSRKEKKA